MYSTIGRYKVIQFLGEGGAGQVYRAVDPSIQREVAIKMLTANTSDQRHRFNQEAVMLAQLEHPNIVPIYDFGEHDGNPYIVMRYMPGGTLHDRLQSKRLNYAEIVSILQKVASGLDFAHNAGIVHRDIKPANILFNEHGVPQIGDFGLSKIFTANTAGCVTQDKILGTPHYMSPEQIKGGQIDHLSDIYSLGVILFEICNGRVPFDAEDALGILYKHGNEPVPTMPHLPPSISEVIVRSMAKETHDRYPSAGHMLSALSTAVDGMRSGTAGTGKIKSETGAVTGQTTVTIERSYLLYGGIGLVGLILIGSIILFGGGGSPQQEGIVSAPPTERLIALESTATTRPLTSTPNAGDSTTEPVPTQTKRSTETEDSRPPTATIDPNPRLLSSPIVFRITRDEADIYIGPGREGYETIDIPARVGDTYDLIAFNAARTWVLIELSTGLRGWVAANTGEISGGTAASIPTAVTEPAPKATNTPRATNTPPPTSTSRPPTAVPPTQPPPTVTSVVISCSGASPTRVQVGNLARIINFQVNVRQGPGTNFSIINRLTPGRDVTIIDGPVCDDGQLWYRIDTGSFTTADGSVIRVDGWVVEESGDTYFLEPIR